MKFVVTGALGHIGSRLIREIPAAMPEAEVVMIDNFATLRYCSLFNLPCDGNYQFVEADVLRADLDPILSGADVVIHLAAITDAANSFQNREQVEHVNFTATRRVAESCARNGCGMFFVSSTSVYGSQSENVDENCPLDDLKPQSPYAETKLREEQLLREIAYNSDLQFVICRFGTICGMSPGMRFHTAVNKFCYQAVMRQPISVWRTALHQRRPYLELGDAVRAILHVARIGLFDGNVYNVLTGNHTVHEIIQFIQTHVPSIDIEMVDAEIMNQLSYHVLCDRFQLTGFQFSGDLSASVRGTIQLLSAIRNNHERKEDLHAA